MKLLGWHFAQEDPRTAATSLGPVRAGDLTRTFVRFQRWLGDLIKQLGTGLGVKWKAAPEQQRIGG